MGLEAFNSPHGDTLHLVDGASAQQRNFTTNYDNMDGSFTAQPGGFTGVMKAPSADTWSLHYWRGDGYYISASQTIYGKLVYAGGPAGGVLLAGDMHFYSGIPPRHQAWFFGRNDTYLSWAHDLASPGTVFGLGCDMGSSCIVITDGGSGNISAQWFDSNGTALTGEFTLISAFSAGANTWFETAPLIGGGVAVRRVDQQNDSKGRPFQTSAWLVTIGAGQIAAQAAPKWMKDRPSTQLAIARSGKAYAVLPMGAPAADCDQKVEVVAADGTSCGSLDIGIAAGKCRTENVALGLDGTPIQLMPREFSQPNTCSYRWWMHALQ
jgi:hypothetical protein